MVFVEYVLVIIMDVQPGCWWGLLFLKENICSAVIELSKLRAPFFSSFALSISALFSLGLNSRITLGVGTRFHGKRD